ncbi:MAG TPA: glutathione S-transferase C-terminal domain-containing protein [Aliidongia sp.]|nr:glutathione S-transferase C-terminal domain-containing protein [Aliidongia sp.]HEV2675303.1 glutathione S-transferase C-terminal domain-containing protein [Aliidongia sp.]
MQLVYEINLRPAEKQHQPWIDRVERQLRTTYGLLEAGIAGAGDWLVDTRPRQADISIAVAWRFTQDLMADRVAASEHPALRTFSALAEALPAFLACPPD